jgi:hypothetical protein
MHHCNKSYIGQTSRSLKLRFQECTRCVKHNEPQSAYALHILDSNHEYGTISDTMSLLKQIDEPSLLSYEQLYIQLVYYNNQLISEQPHMKRILRSNYFTTDISHTSPVILILPHKPGVTSFIPPSIPDSHPHRYVSLYINYNFIAFSDYFFLGVTAPGGPWPPLSRGF